MTSSHDAARKPSSPVSRPKKAAKRAKDVGDMTQAEKQEAALMDAEGNQRAAQCKAAADAHALEAWEAANTGRRPNMTPDEQRAEIERAALEHGAVLRKVGNAR